EQGAWRIRVVLGGVRNFFCGRAAVLFPRPAKRREGGEASKRSADGEPGEGQRTCRSEPLTRFADFVRSASSPRFAGRGKKESHFPTLAAISQARVGSAITSPRR